MKPKARWWILLCFVWLWVAVSLAYVFDTLWHWDHYFQDAWMVTWIAILVGLVLGTVHEWNSQWD